MPQLTPAAGFAETVKYLADSDWGLYFHGTAKAFDTFELERVGAGGDANCALGFFATSCPRYAAQYARQVSGDGQGVVLVTLVRERRPFEFANFDEFYGVDWPDSGHPERDRQAFTQLRTQLLQQGYDSAWLNLEPDGTIAVALAPQHILVLGHLTVPSAESLAEAVAGDERARTDEGFKREFLAAIEQPTVKR